MQVRYALHFRNDTKIINNKDLKQNVLEEINQANKNRQASETCVLVLALINQTERELHAKEEFSFIERTTHRIDSHITAT